MVALLVQEVAVKVKLHKKMSIKTAILIFANSAKKDAKLKSFKSEALFNVLTAKTIKIADRTGLTYFHITEAEQFGVSFGSRFTNAIQNIFKKGFDQVITIGNDSPHLKASHITKAANLLVKNDIVLGPSKDGGFYLMGIKKSHFDTKIFQKLPWQTSELNQSISQLAVLQNIKLSYLEILQDIDTVSDAKHIIDSFKMLSKQIKLLLQDYISIEKKTSNSTIILLSTFSQKRLFNKGSPLFS